MEYNANFIGMRIFIQELNIVSSACGASLRVFWGSFLTPGFEDSFWNKVEISNFLGIKEGVGKLKDVRILEEIHDI